MHEMIDTKWEKKTIQTKNNVKNSKKSEAKYNKWWENKQLKIIMWRVIKEIKRNQWIINKCKEIKILKP